MTTALLVAWLRAFVFTQVIEAPIYRSWLGTSWTKALAASAITHPFVWFVFPPLREARGASYVDYLVGAELFAWLVEAAFFALASRVPWRRALVVSLVANGTSVVMGFVCRALFGVP